MDKRFLESRDCVLNAREALRRGDVPNARQWAERAARLAPQSEDAWLILAAAASPRESVGYIRKALQMNPESPRAHKALEWALGRLREIPEERTAPLTADQPQAAARSEAVESPKKRSLLIPILLILMGCMVVGIAAYSAATSPALASILSVSNAPTHAQSFAQVEIAKPTYTAMPAEVVVTPTPTPTQIFVVPLNEIPTQPPAVEPTIEALPTATLLPEATSTPEAASVPEATSTPGVLYAEIVPDTPTPENFVPTAAPAAVDVPPDVTAPGEHWIDVDLTQQRVYAYAGDTIVNSFLVSTGTWDHPTVTGKYKIWIKLRYTDMAGPGYYLPDVPYTMYFYGGYGLHGTYWHSNFGTPMSHGCVNLSIPDAAWLYDFAYEGTTVNVHY